MGTYLGPKFQTPFWHLPDDVCHHCRKKFGPKDLIISQAFVDPADTVLDMPIHATCRNKMNKGQYDESDTCCDYCGLSLSPLSLDFELREKRQSYDNRLKPNKLLESGLEQLFDEPYSKIFSYIKTDNHYLDQMGQHEGLGEHFHPASFFNSVRKNGEKYHPYCARKLGIKE